MDPERRGAGVGKRLNEHVRHIARAEGCSRICWLIR
ncbi:GNAT family N-acetyltransferase [Chthonobacter albigriseus]